ncbi:uncharacterized protein LOC114910702 [Scleropages formosus]|uniref:uncharacterized protein LOC114910702 n=1 Tax=Scleropages formosus TaxID=113540 RepID=UPI0010FA7D99|nr:uncharacterized protein LOC114910702 [Scleropages formosus]
MMNLSSVFLIFTGFLAELFASQVVSLKGTAVLFCYRTQNTPAEQQDVIWRIAEGQLVAQWSRGRFTAGPGYEGRVQLSEKGIEGGNFSLTISPVEYNDEGSYDCFTGFDHLAVVTLGVSVSTDRNITAQVGDPVTLPCYANVGKQANLSHLNIRWEKDGQTVLDIQSGTGSGFKNRVSLSPDRVRTPEGISLSIAGRQSNITIQSPESLFLPLHTKEPVHVLFSSGGCTSVSVCTVEGDSVDCGPQYQHRASVHNSTLMLEYTTPADSGVYRVMDNRTNDTINTVSVSVTVSPTVLFPLLSLLLLLGAWCCYG